VRGADVVEQQGQHYCGSKDDVAARAVKRPGAEKVRQQVQATG